jgi:hypothetical protein
MKLKRLFNTLFVICLLVIVISVPMVSVHAAPVFQDSAPVDVDWNQVVFQIAAFAIPILVAALTAQAGVSIRYGLQKLKLERPDIADMIQRAAVFAVPVVEQLRKMGVIPDWKTAKEEAMRIGMAFLTQKGFDVYQIEPYLQLLDQAIEGEVAKLPKFSSNVLKTPSEELR